MPINYEIVASRESEANAHHFAWHEMRDGPAHTLTIMSKCKHLMDGSKLTAAPYDG